MTQLTIAQLRSELGWSLDRFAREIGIASKGNASIIEREQRCSVDVALAIEALSVRDGRARIDAASLNEDVAKSREACTAICHKDIQSHHGLTDNAAAPAPSTGKMGKSSRGQQVAA